MMELNIYFMPNGVAEAGSGDIPINTNPLQVRATTTPVPGRWGEAQAVPGYPIPTAELVLVNLVGPAILTTTSAPATPGTLATWSTAYPAMRLMTISIPSIPIRQGTPVRLRFPPASPTPIITTRPGPCCCPSSGCGATSPRPTSTAPGVSFSGMARPRQSVPTWVETSGDASNSPAISGLLACRVRSLPATPH